jgi:transcriptional regulator with XRE-family HTH domain
METSINSRLEEIINTLYKGNKRAFSSVIGVSPTVIENVVGTRQGKPSYDVIEKICAKANISPDWLITGTGSMLRTEQPSATSVLPVPTVIYERDPRDIQLIATQEDLIKALKREIQGQGFRAESQGGVPSADYPCTSSGKTPHRE